MGLVVGGFGKTLALVVLAHKGTNHASARKALAADKRDTVELCLQLLVIRNAARHDKPKHQADGGRANQKDDAELKVDGEGRDHGAHRQERPADEHTHAQRHGELHLVDVVGNARDERRRAKAIELSIAQLVDVLVECAANVGAHALRGERRHLLADERKRDADHGHSGKYHAVVDNGARRASQCPYRSSGQSPAASAGQRSLRSACTQDQPPYTGETYHQNA